MSSQLTISVVLCLLISSTSVVYAWGWMGHELTAKIAENFLTDDTWTQLKLLIPEADGKISKIASWADQIKRNPKYAWTKPLHYVDTLDDPPNSCSFNPKRDCPDGKCVLNAITDFAKEIFGVTAPTPEVNDAAKFLVHFVGDIHQPLHVSGKERGGNGERAYFDGRSTNLHSIWDTYLLKKHIDEDFKGNTDRYVKYLLESLHKKWGQEAPTWTQCSSKMALEGKEFDVCPNDWASYIDSVNCKSVWQTNQAGSAYSNDLGGSYYQKNKEVVDKLILMGGIRLGHILNQLLDENGDHTSGPHLGSPGSSRADKHDLSSATDATLEFRSDSPGATVLTLTDQ